MGRLSSAVKFLGFDLEHMLANLTGIPGYYRDYRKFKAQTKAAKIHIPLSRYYPVLHERKSSAGVATGHYFHQDLYVARRIYRLAPERHVDIGSRIDGFAAHVAVFRKIEIVDIRQLATSAENIQFIQADLMDDAAVGQLERSPSVSCLHALEHFGLGRYGDPVDVDGYCKGLLNCASLVSPGGRFYVSVPIGPERVEFNAHRVFSAATFPSLMPERFVLDRFSYVDDAGEFHEDVDFSEKDVSRNFGCSFGCGIYEFVDDANKGVESE